MSDEYYFTVRVECTFKPETESLLERALNDRNTFFVDGVEKDLNEDTVLELPEDTLRDCALALFEEEAMAAIEDHGCGIGTDVGTIDLGTPWYDPDPDPPTSSEKNVAKHVRRRRIEEVVRRLLNDMKVGDNYVSWTDEDEELLTAALNKISNVVEGDNSEEV